MDFHYILLCFVALTTVAVSQQDVCVNSIVCVCAICMTSSLVMCECDVQHVCLSCICREWNRLHHTIVNLHDFLRQEGTLWSDQRSKKKREKRKAAKKKCFIDSYNKISILMSRYSTSSSFLKKSHLYYSVTSFPWALSFLYSTSTKKITPKLFRIKSLRGWQMKTHHVHLDRERRE